MVLSSWIPGAVGLLLRKIMYPWLLGAVGRNVVFGQGVVLQVDAFPDEVFVGRVTAVGRQADAQTLTFPVRVEWENTDGKF